MAAKRCPGRTRSRASAGPPGIHIHRGDIADDEICLVQSIYCTTPARTAYDIDRRVPRDASVILIDALLNATRCTVADVSRIADRHIPSSSAVWPPC
jgi:hypothetical protein